MRQQGILMPISSIPSKYGIGTFGRESYRFVDFLEQSGTDVTALTRAIEGRKDLDSLAKTHISLE